MSRSKNAIALLITVMFVIVITVAIGLGLKQVNVAGQEVKNENFMYQSSIIIEDVMKILKNSPDLKRVADGNSSSDFFTFISQASYIPFASSGIDIILQVSSARGKFNPKQLENNETRVDIVREYFTNNRINSEYMNLLLDNVSRVKADNSYNSAIFNENPYLFRDYIASSKHLKVINDFYTKEYNDNSLKNIDFEKLFYFSDSNETKIDLNYATPEVWEMIAGVSKERASELHAGGGFYETIDDIGLSDTELERVQKFNVSTQEKFIFVNVEIMKEKSKAKISFEYDIKNNKGSNFVYEI